MAQILSVFFFTSFSTFLYFKRGLLPESNSGVSWLNNSTVEQGAHQYIYCYHGRRTDYLLTLLCQSIYGWDADIWDFSGSRPVLK